MPSSPGIDERVLRYTNVAKLEWSLCIFDAPAYAMHDAQRHQRLP